MRNADRDNAVCQRWPQEASALQSLREQARALAVMPNDLDQVTAAAPKNVEITSVRIPLQTLLNQTRKARESAAHIGMAGRKPHPHIARYGSITKRRILPHRHILPNPARINHRQVTPFR